MIGKFKVLLIALVLLSIPLVAYAHTIYIDGVNTNIEATVEGDNIIIPISSQIEISGDQINLLSSPPDVLQNIVEVDIPVSDGTIQKAKFYASKAQNKPLVIWLHTWSDTYNTLYEYQGVNLPEECLLRDWNYIQPNFRGANNNPDACASNKVITDIDSAISYAIANGHVDTSKIYVVGASGGGHAALSHFMRSTQNVVDGYYTWVPITDLMAWYYQTQDKSYEGYWYDISNSLTCDGVINVTEAKNRSPLWNTTPATKFNDTFIKMYAGIRDGYNGTAVPFSHSILMFNKLCKDRGLSPDRVPLDEMYYMIDNFAPSTQQNLGALQGDRNILYTKSVPNLDLIIFDGAHEMIVQHAIWDIENEISH
jgi:hypothetical protein